MSALGVVGFFGASLVSALVLLGVLEAARALGQTRLDLPLLLGAFVAVRRRSARRLGRLLFVLLACGLSLVAAVPLRAVAPHAGVVARGVAGAVVMTACALLVGVPLLVAVHPRIAREREGARPSAPLEPPGLFALGYGARTPVVVLAAHLAWALTLARFLAP